MLACAVTSTLRPITSTAQCVLLHSSPQAAPGTAAVGPGSSRPRISLPCRGQRHDPAASADHVRPSSTDGSIRLGCPASSTPAPWCSVQSPDPDSTPEHSRALKTWGLGPLCHFFRPRRRSTPRRVHSCRHLGHASIL
ncbi:hypothetical protein NDU88_004600 [Pleurodeles waltl]|uniref:Uncharacterized protein n=1 Tax=Pleurodeles waltl TaxID=8319 RepID=A0AAV7MAD7_PLEWA|nr:hypothetical protein NDU88_004600 [Pleurodeles waltl]